ncbi:MAG: hypothetical protein A3B30_00885 [Candidatus Komeilibacteria bacterium RIFCSPLOWO2_01_FULL_52_15]|uniref:Glycosyltransferase 2-like domain-containing protein n=2 Tax=Candidatus Komeiliibacteriota TaxID=1817908 RepID=A0A1G2BN51_9BACT|nr:MAG: hypothetical protein A2677_00100 [Candidatus Komeilibacteria bacterium RIFCSPHIGHO2_01_FULL_52_14]OGY90562.1 MAG: hypothetical protein A3B30_00885 [Candidatus Komeilibacteria bacterium RIFCSPLOWO2_01_FULL_52_15]
MQFSIIIPTKNELANMKRLLPQYDALRGAASYEVIVADGASTDGTIQYARTITNRVEVKTKQERETIGEGRNRGAAVAQGDVLVFVDAGVRIPDVPGFFQAITRHFTDTTVVAAVPRVSIDPGVATFADRLVHGTVNLLIRASNALGWGSGKGETQIIRHSAFQKVGGYNEKLVAAEDHDMMMRLSKIGKVKFLPELTVYDDPSRYRKLGYPRVIGLWILNWFSMRIFRRSFSKEWKRAT